MAIKIQHTYSTHVNIAFYSDEGIILRCTDYGTMDDIAERVCEVLIKHNFCQADVTSSKTGELLIILERT